MDDGTDTASNITNDRPAPIRDNDGRHPYVVVGVDGSPGARAALLYALTTTAQRGTALDVVATYPVNVVWTGGYPLDIPDTQAIRTDTETRAQAAVDEVRSDPSIADVPGADAVDIRLVVSAGRAVPVLLERSEGADLLVVGSRGRGAMRSALLGSVALHCVSHAPCPVVVVHSAPVGASRPRGVVVGVDGSAGSRAALVAATEEAGRNSSEVEVVATYVLTDYWTDMAAVVVPSI